MTVPPKLNSKRDQVREYVLGQIANGMQRDDRLLTEWELAEVLGVSKSTVRKALEGLVEEGIIYQQRGKGTFVRNIQHPDIRSTTREKTRLIGYISPFSHDDSFMREITLGVEESLDPHSFILMTKHIHMSLTDEASVLERIADQVHGMILLSALEPRTIEVIRGLLARGYPLVLIDRFHRDLHTGFVVTDNIEVGIAATEHLIGLGHRRIVYLTHPGPVSSTSDRQEGYLVAMRRHDLKPQIITAGHAETADVIDGWTKGDMPSAVVCVHDVRAERVLDELQKRGIRVPDDISVVGVDNNQRSQELELTTVAQPKYQMGYRAAKLLQDRLMGYGHATNGIYLQPTLLVRKTTAPPRD